MKIQSKIDTYVKEKWRDKERQIYRDIKIKNERQIDRQINGERQRRKERRIYKNIEKDRKKAKYECYLRESKRAEFALVWLLTRMDPNIIILNIRVYILACSFSACGYRRV